MARQNTFTIIPQAPRFDADTTPARPMTSKQVRKAYKAASKTPTMTRAERLKWEREEQDRIRKEFEKEKAAAKARAAREKKKEKEMQQREEKRRNGLPLVNVRPSQDTIARFVRGNGSKKKRDAEGLLVPAQLGDGGKHVDAVTTPEADATVLGSILEAEEEMDENETTAHVASDDSTPSNINNKTSEHSIGIEGCPTTVQEGKTDDKQAERVLGLVSEDHDVDLSFEAPIDKAMFDAALDLVPMATAGALSDTTPPDDMMENPAKQTVDGAAQLASSQDLLDDEINTDMLEELDELLCGGKTPAKPQSARPPSTKQITASSCANITSHNERQNRTEYKAATSPQAKRKSPSQRKAERPVSPGQSRHAPPTCTQAILVNFDDFFPTSSQQLRELEEEREPSQHRNTPQPLKNDGQEDTTTGANIPTRSLSNHAAVTRAGTEDLESAFSSFPSTGLSLFDCSAAAQPLRQTPRHAPRTDKPGAGASSKKPVLEPRPAASPPQPQPQPQPSRFFTSSGSREQLSLALQRSRRSAALEKLQEKERRRQEAGLVARQGTRDDARRQPASPARRPCDAEHDNAASSCSETAAVAQQADKENVQPADVRCSQETEYGGDWMEDAAWDLALC
ncbi:hypothetical protein V2A60_002566 [Cordyceps javanica]|uniref:Uncharacterized protein n=1 Tax=Cordyceps javanica TaxID=43265 RepID=A0A545VX20_9HYPO|nr:hypothetical protein IF1G_07281 [Cordyceps javanica]TQW06271.1 hypothetical protein IF2G_06554 [Cordyceps javanica]